MNRRVNLLEDRLKMKGFLQEYGNIIVVVAVILLMLLFGKTGFAKNIQDAILGSANHIVETGENVVPKPAKASDIIEIEGTKYVVLEERENNQALVMTASSIGKKAFQSDYDKSTYLRPDGQNVQTYEGSEIDDYLENKYYGSLTSKLKDAIVESNIRQFSYSSYDITSKKDTAPDGSIYNVLSRHVYLPSIEEIGKLVDLNSSDKIKLFLNNVSIWTRDNSFNNNKLVMDFDASYGGLGNNWASVEYDVRPAFVIDLSQVDYKVAGHVDYK